MAETKIGGRDIRDGSVTSVDLSLSSAPTMPVGAGTNFIVLDSGDNLVKKIALSVLETYFNTKYNNYIHPTGDGNSHVPTTGTTNNGKVLMAGPSANSFSWTTLSMSDIPDAAFKKSVKAATTADLGAASATSTTITGTLVVFPTQDGVTLALNDRILVKNQTSAAQNGIYILTTVGVAATTAWVLTRASDADNSSEIAGGVVNVDLGTLNGAKLFTNTFKTTDTLGTTAMSWFKVLDANDTIPVNKGGTGLSTLGTANQLVRVNAGASALEYFTPTYLTSVPQSTDLVLGTVKLFSSTAQSVAANAVSAVAARTYGIQLNASGQAVVNVPWSDTNTWTQLTGTVSGFVPTQGASSVRHFLNGNAGWSTFGTAANTIAEGNDSRILNGQTAFSWGNHAGLYRPITYVPSWSEINTKPTTILGFGITDAVEKFSIGGNDYVKSVVLLHNLTDEYQFFSGELNIRRSNNLYPTTRVEVISGKPWTLNNPIGNQRITNPQGDIRLVTCMYGGKKWLGVVAFVSDAAADVECIGSYSTKPIRVGYYQTNTATVLNTEINNSITTIVLSGSGDDFGGQISVPGGNSTNWNSAFGWGNHAGKYPTYTGVGATGTWPISISGSAGSAPNGSNQNSQYLVSAGDGNGIKFWGLNSYKISMGAGIHYLYGPVTDYSIKMQMDAPSTGRGFTWGREDVVPVAALNATSGNFQTAGTITAGNDVIAFSTSDKRFKDNIQRILNPIDKIMSIGGYTFDWNSKQDIHSGKDVGVIAQEIEAVIPEIVTTRDNGYKAVKYDKLVALLIEGMKEQQLEIEKLKKLTKNLN